MTALIHVGDCREGMAQFAAAGLRAQTCVTSPPYFGLRDYGHEGQIGLEQTPEQYVAEMVDVFRNVRNVLADDGTLWINIGDSYGKGKQLLGVPWRLAFALQADGWVLRRDIIWEKPNAQPDAAKDRPSVSHEYLFLFSKRERYFYDYAASKEPATAPPKACGPKTDASRNDAGRTRIVRGDGVTRNRRSVWTVATRPYKGAHFATFPPALIEPCILVGSKPGDFVLDPFMGSGTTAEVAIRHGRLAMGCELNPEYKKLIDERLSKCAQP